MRGILHFFTAEALRRRENTFVTIQRTQKPKDYHHEEHEAHEGRFKQF